MFNEVKHLEREPGYGEIVYGVVYNTSEGRIEVYPFGLSSGNPIAISNEKILIPYAEAEKFGFRIPPEFALPKKVSVLQKIAGLLGLPRKPKMPTSRTGNSSVVEIAPGIFVQGNHSGNFESRKPSGKGKGKRRR